MSKSLSRELFVIVFKAITVVITIVLIIVGVTALYDVETRIGDGACNVAVLPVEGVILPYYGVIDAPLVTTPQQIEDFMTSAEHDGSIKAVLVEINSPGGTPVAAARIADRLHSSSLPTVGLIGDIGASGGYMVAAATNYLIASPMSEVGSIGVTMSYIEQSKKNTDEGLTYVELNTGKFKDAGSPDKPLTDDERALFQKGLDIVHNEFIDLVARYRAQPREKIAALADGSTLTGALARDNGLIDGVGGRSEARAALAHLLDTREADIVFCEYEAPIIPL